MFPSPIPSHTDRLLTEFSKVDKPNSADFARLYTQGVIFDTLDRYRMRARGMSEEALSGESHRSQRLAKHLGQAGDPRPSGRCDAHAIISGGHRGSIVLRGVLALMKVRIDDPHNGCWLPRDWVDRPHLPGYLRNAVPHRRIHHRRYYEWLGARIRPVIVRSPQQLIESLRMARRQLQDGTVPPGVMPQTGR